MRQTILAERYAKALTKAARKAGVLEEVGDQLAALAKGSSVADADVRFWKNPMVEKPVKRELFRRLAAQTGLEETLLRFLTLLVEKNRLWLLRPIEEEYRRILDRLLGRASVTVSTAKPLSETLKARLAETLTEQLGKQVSLRERVDPELVGGLIIRYENRIVDGTVGARLRTLARAVTGV